MWLLGRLYPDHKSIAEFRRMHRDAVVADSAQYRVVEGQLQRSKKPVTLRGLNQDHNHDLKDIFKGAARVSSSSGPLHDFYEHLLAQGGNPRWRT